MFFGLKLASALFQLVYSFFPIAGLMYFAYKLWEEKRSPVGFFYFYFALLLTFISSFQSALLTLEFDVLYEYEATIATAIFTVGLGFSLVGIRKLARSIDENLGVEISRTIRFTAFLCAGFVFLFYAPLFFKIPRPLLWKIGGLFYVVSSVLIWGLFISLAKMVKTISPMRKQSELLRVLSFYLLVEPVVYLLLVSFDVLPRWLYTSRFVMALLGAMLGAYVLIFVIIFTRKQLPEFLKEIQPSVKEHIKLRSLRQIRSFVTISFPTIAILLVLQLYLIKNYILYQVENYASAKTQILDVLANNMEFSANSIFKSLEELSKKKDVIDIDIPSLHFEYAQVHSRMPGCVRNVSRVDERGILRYTYPPDPKAIGRDISYQEHIKKFLLQKRAFVSSVFRAVQGYDAIALGYPVFDEKGKFKGSVTCLIDVEKMIEHFVRLAGKSLDFFFVVEGDKVLSSNVQEMSGKNFYEFLKMASRNDDADKFLRQYEDSLRGEIVLDGRNRFGRKITFGVSFSNVELLQTDGVFWRIFNFVDEETIISRVHQRFKLYFYLFLGSIVVLFYFIAMFIGSINYSFTLEDEINEQIAKLVESERRYRALAENPFVGMAIIGGSGFVTVNDRLCEILGYTKEELMNMNPVEIFHPDDREVAKKKLKTCLAGQSLPEKTEARGIRKNGQLINLVYYCRTINYEGKPSVIAVFLDLTREKKQEEMIRHLQRVESIGTLTAGMAHDFNNILQIIIASAQFMDFKISKGDFNRDELKKYIDNIVSISNRGAELIKRLKIFTRKEIPGAEVVEFDEIVSGMVEIMKQTFPRFIAIEASLGAGGHKVLCSRVEIQQVILNIASNSKDAIIEKRERGMFDGEGKIILRSFVKNVTYDEAEIFKVLPGRYVGLSIEDNGIGMDEKTRERVFEPFFTTKRPEIGTGLGMATVFGIINSHNGFINVESEPGKGTKVSFFLPIARVEMETTERDIHRRERPKAVLFLCEDYAMKKEVREKLKGVDVLFADDRVIAVKVLAENLESIGAVVIDGRMQRLKLIETITEIKIHNKELKIFVLSPSRKIEVEGVLVFDKLEDMFEVLLASINEANG